MEDIFLQLHPHEQEWLADKLSAGMSIKDYVKLLIQAQYKEENP